MATVADALSGLIARGDLDEPEPGVLRALRDDLDAGVPLSLGEVADRLDLPFDELVTRLAPELFKLDPSIGGVAVLDVRPEAIH